MKRNMLLSLGLLACSISAHLLGCTVTLVNDLTTPVSVVPGGTNSLIVPAGSPYTFGQPDQMASFVFVKQVQGKTFRYRVTQTSCSPTHEITVYASQVGNGPIEYFDVSNNLNATSSGGCGCAHKDRPHEIR